MKMLALAYYWPSFFWRWSRSLAVVEWTGQLTYLFIRIQIEMERKTRVNQDTLVSP